MYLPTLSLLALTSTALAADMTLMEVLAAENTTLSTLNSLLAAQPALVSTLSGITTGITILAPSNAAFNNFLSIPGNKEAAANPGTVAAILEYHVLNGTFPSSLFTSMNQFIPSLLTNETFTNVTGGQVVNGVIQGGKVVLRSGLKEASTVQTANLMFTGGVVHIIDTVLTLPLNPSFSALDSNLTALAGALTDTTLIDAVDSLKDVTIFAPSNAAFQAIGSATGSLSTQQLAGILEYHVINGTVGYSSLLTTGLANESFPTLQGGDVAVSVEDGKVFVNSAQVIITDIIVSNGVMHVLDNVLNPSAASLTPDPTATTQSVAFAGASGVADVPFTSGIVPTTTAPSASTNTAAAPGRQENLGKMILLGVLGAGVGGWAL